MLNTVFLQILNMSFTASVVILFVLLARLLLKKNPKVISYALWGVVLFRLICPFSFESWISLLPVKTNPIPSDIMYAQVPRVDTGIAAINDGINRILPAATPYGSVNPMQGWIFIGCCLWITGIAVLLAYSVVSLCKLRGMCKGATWEKENIYSTSNVASPFVMGLFRPKIYLPAGLTDAEKEYIIVHEQTHIKRFDHVIKVISFFVLCLHWFNPLVWAAFFYCGRDMELSCDERVIKSLGNGIKKDYSSSLLALATGKRVVGGTPLAFGEGDTKSRIKNVLSYKRPAFWVVVLSSIAVVVVAIGLLANPASGGMPTPQTPITLSAASGVDVTALWNARTKYVGDNAAVGKLLGLLPLPKGLQHNHFALLTSGEQRGVEWSLDVAENASYDANAFRRPALLLFALIDNLEDFYVITTDTRGGTTEIHYDRSWAEKTMGGDVRDYAESAEKLQMLLDQSADLVAQEVNDQITDGREEELPTYPLNVDRQAMPMPYRGE